VTNILKNFIYMVNSTMLLLFFHCVIPVSKGIVYYFMVTRPFTSFQVPANKSTLQNRNSY